MADRRHPDARRILSHLRSVAGQLGPRASWTRYAFHFTEMANVPSILRTNALYSRTEAERLGLIQSHVGDPGIVSRTDQRVRDSVRFYWRPRTPMLYQIEGVRATDRYRYQARCDIPVYICVPLSDILARSDVLFTDRNAASPSHTIGSTYEFVAQIPFELVYHDEAFSPEARNEIISRRQAEILVPKQFTLTAGTQLLVRSEAELDTLRGMLEGVLADIWNPRIAMATSYPAFFGHWLYVSRVSRSGDELRILFNERARVEEVGGPIPITVRLDNLETGKSQVDRYQWPDVVGIMYTGLQQYSWRITVIIDQVLGYSAAVAP